MARREELKREAAASIDDRKEHLVAVGERIFANPELGYKERETGELIANELEAMGLQVEKNLALTGCKATVRGPKEGPIIGVMGELDAVVCRDHPKAHRETGAAHACGHHIQLGVMMGVAAGLVGSGVMNELAGGVSFLAVPAEEYVELGFRSQLRARGEIGFFGGKQEFLRKGHLDDIDIAISTHSSPDLAPHGKKVMIGSLGTGFVGKHVQYRGKPSHAGAAPEKGVNALNAAILGLLGIHTQRETFPEQERIRVHPIITKGGDLVNIVPDDVQLETYVRGFSIEGIRDANTKVNRALRAGAMAVGAEVKITEIPGYMPLVNTPDLDALFKENLLLLLEDNEIVEGGDFAGSTDFGDISQIMPSSLAVFGGVNGALHTKDFHLEDPELAYIIPAKAIAFTIIDLLLDGAGMAQQVIRDFQPKMSKAQYFEFQEEMSREINWQDE
ncbi:MAG: amidohydrolase [Firmicutes bacterium]|nr:amidohydrolase [Bacillota bacterium]HXL04856.1 amidohydrolase [Bacillota bacterium]